MTQVNKNEISKWANLLVFVFSLLPVILLLYVISQRICYPYDIEWAEGPAYNQVMQIISGNPIFVEPNLSFSPLVYTPLYYYISAGMTQLLGSAFSAMRVVSVISTAGSAVLIYLIVFKQSQHHLASWLSSCLYLACFSLADGYYDLARVDSLYIFLLLATFFGFVHAQRWWGTVLVGLGIALTFFVKQSALLIFLPIILIVIVLDLKRYWLMAVSAAIGIVVPWLIVDINRDGLFTYYIYTLPRQHGYSILSAIDFWVGDTLRPLGVSFGFAGFYWIWLLRDLRDRGAKIKGNSALQRAARLLLTSESKILIFAIFTVAASWLTRATNGGGSNNVMAVYAVLAILFGLGFHWANSGDVLRFMGEGYKNIFLSLVVIVQFVGLLYNPFNYIPTKKDYTINEELLQIITEEEQTLIPYRSHLPVVAGKDSQIHIVNLFELTGYFKGDVLPEGLAIVDQIRKKICEQDYSVIIFDQPIPWFAEQVSFAYEKSNYIDNGVNEKISSRQSPVTNWQKGYRNIYEPKSGFDPGTCPQ